MPPIAGQNAMSPSAMDALASQGGGANAAPGGQGGDARGQVEQAVSTIRDLSGKLAELGKMVPNSDGLVKKIQTDLRQLAVMAANAGATQNGSASALPG